MLLNLSLILVRDTLRLKRVHSDTLGASSLHATGCSALLKR